MDRLSLAKGEGEGEDCVKAINAAARQIQPLTFILSPSPRGEAIRPPSRTDLDFDRLTNDVIRITSRYLWTSFNQAKSNHFQRVRRISNCFFRSFNADCRLWRIVFT